MVAMMILLILSVTQIFASAIDSKPETSYEPVHLQNVKNTAIPFLNYTGVDKRWGREIIEISADPTTVSTLHLPNYSIGCEGNECEGTTPMPTFKPYTQEELNIFLQKYVESNGRLPQPEKPTNKLANLYMDEPVNILEKDPEHGHEKPKSWQLMQAEANNHPYDDRNGWVTLEPVAWSSSQIQKWEPNSRPQIPQWEADEKPSYSYKPTKYPERPTYKPTYEYQQKPWNDNKYKPNNWHGDNYGSNSQSDIITDHSPSQFPHDPPKKPTWYERPHQTEVVYHPEKESNYQNRPEEGDGRWVLLSSTKGYSVPHRNRAFQRALTINAKTPTSGHSVKTHRSIKLTVLPALNNSSTVTSHGGMIEVEKTQQTVDEAQREHAAKMMRLKNTTDQPVASRRSGSVKVYPIRFTPNQQSRNNAVLAAVGAGMVPATMAMLLPLVLGKRRRRSIDTYSGNFDPGSHHFLYTSQ